MSAEYPIPVQEYIRTRGTVGQLRETQAKAPQFLRDLYDEALQQGEKNLDELTRNPLVRTTLTAVAAGVLKALRGLEELQGAIDTGLLDPVHLEEKRTEILTEDARYALEFAELFGEEEETGPEEIELVEKKRPREEYKLPDGGSLVGYQAQIMRFLEGATEDAPISTIELAERVYGSAGENNKITAQIHWLKKRLGESSGTEIVTGLVNKESKLIAHYYLRPITTAEPVKRPTIEEVEAKKELSYEESASIVLAFLGLYKELLTSEFNMDKYVIDEADFDQVDLTVVLASKKQGSEEIRVLRHQALQKIRDFMTDEGAREIIEAIPGNHPLFCLAVFLMDFELNFDIEKLQNHETRITPIEFLDELVDAENHILYDLDMGRRRGASPKNIRREVIVRGYKIQKKVYRESISSPEVKPADHQKVEEKRDEVVPPQPRDEIQAAETIVTIEELVKTETKEAPTIEVPLQKQEEVKEEKPDRKKIVEKRITTLPSPNRLKSEVRALFETLGRLGLTRGVRSDRLRNIPELEGAYIQLAKYSKSRVVLFNPREIVEGAIAYRYRGGLWGSKPFMRRFNRVLRAEWNHFSS